MQFILVVEVGDISGKLLEQKVGEVKRSIYLCAVRALELFLLLEMLLVKFDGVDFAFRINVGINRLVIVQEVIFVKGCLPFANSSSNLLHIIMRLNCCNDLILEPRMGMNK
jgi:hypothetical protein